jgi:hypothetical protein
MREFEKELLCVLHDINQAEDDAVKLSVDIIVKLHKRNINLKEKLNKAIRKIECFYPDIIDGHCACSNCEFIREVNSEKN